MADDLPSEYDAIVLGTDRLQSSAHVPKRTQIWPRFSSEAFPRAVENTKITGFRAAHVSSNNTDFQILIHSNTDFYGLAESVVAAALSRIGYKVLHLDRNDYYASSWASFSFDHLQEWVKGNTSQETESTDKDNNEGSTLANSNEKHLSIPQCQRSVINIQMQSFLREEDEFKDESEDIVDLKSEKNTDEGKPDATFASSNPEGQDSREGIQEGEEDASCLNTEISHAEGGSENKPDLGVDNETTKAHTDSEGHAVAGCDVSASLQGTTAPNNTESEAASIDDSGQASEVSNVVTWPERRKMKKEVKLGSDATLQNFSEQSRKFNLDLAPKVLLARGLLVEYLISANIAHYAEFKVVSRILTYINGNIEHVPCCRSDVFGSELISVLEKRALMRFITFCVNLQDSSEEYLDYVDKPFIEFLKARKLTAHLQHIVIHAIAVVPENATTRCGLEATQTFLKSLGRFGNTPYLWSLYGSGELPQAFCRMCAVFGGIYCLRKNVSSLVFDEESNKCVAVISDNGQRLNTKWLIMEKSYAPAVFGLESQCTISRAILITDKSLKGPTGEHITILSLPARNPDQAPIQVIELPPSSMACPPSLHVVHFTAQTSSGTAQENLQEYVDQLFTTPGNEDAENTKPAVLWALYFNRNSFAFKTPSQLPDNVRLTSLPSSQISFEDAMDEAKSIFTSICPDEEFLLAVPNPEDIIWDDVNTAGSTPNDEQASPGEAVGETNIAHETGSIKEDIVTDENHETARCDGKSTSASTTSASSE